MRRALPFIVACVATTGCMGIPTPLAPNLDGSMGVPHAGMQRGAKQLPVRGEGFVRLRRTSDNYWGNPRLVQSISAAARTVKQTLPGGEPLVVGDLSARHGAKIPGHRSHRTGRDVDLLFFVTTPSGAPVPSPGFVKVGTDGLAQVEGDHFVRFDVERNWLLIRTLVASKDAQVQWLFASRGVEALLIDYARARGEPLELVWRAETLLLEPGDSSPHDDHVHVRLACTAAEEVDGCEGGGPRWPWLEPSLSLPELDAQSLRAIAQDDPFGVTPAAEGAAAPGGDV